MRPQKGRDEDEQQHTKLLLKNLDSDGKLGVDRNIYFGLGLWQIYSPVMWNLESDGKLIIAILSSARFRNKVIWK